MKFAGLSQLKSKVSQFWSRTQGRADAPRTTLDQSDLAWLRGSGESQYDNDGRLRSCLCTQQMLESPEFVRWVMRLEPSFLHEDGAVRLHRKLWEYCYIVQALYERNLIRAGSRGLGFAVGREPMVSYFASQGCAVVATELDTARSRLAGWSDPRTIVDPLQALNERGLCTPREFQKLVTFRPVDMNAIPSDLKGFDFCWSSCALEHLGSIEKGQAFLERMLDTLRPGGVGVHTTEFNLLSNDRTVDRQETVLFRKRDIDTIAQRLRARGHHIDLVYQPGESPADLIVDVPPYKENPHLKLGLMNFTTTSIGLIITKATREDAARLKRP